MQLKLLESNYSGIPIFRALDFSKPRFFEPWQVSLGFASVKRCNFTPDFSNLRLFETPDISYQFLPLMEEIYKKFTFDFSKVQRWFVQIRVGILKKLKHLYPHFSSLSSFVPEGIVGPT